MWTPIPIDGKLFQNIDETALTRAFAAMENCFINDAGGHSRFPGLETFCNLSGQGRVYLQDWRGDLMAATSLGNLYRIREDGSAENVTGVPIAGGRRTIFAKTPDELVMAAGGQLIRFSGKLTEILSEDAPQAAFVAFLDNYLLATETYSGRFQHSTAGAHRTWDPLDTFAADGKPDDINGMIVTPFRELLLCGEESIEQFERLQTGNIPFFRRWAIGEGVSVPYSPVFADNAVYIVNHKREFVRFSGQTSRPESGDIDKVLSAADDWTDAWVGGFPDQPLNLAGQKFILLQLPNATNPYGTRGLTFVLDYRHKRWTTLYGWDDVEGLPARWPGWSHWSLWDRTFVGGDGVIYRFTDTGYRHGSGIQRMLGRTAHFGRTRQLRIENVRMRIKRGIGTNETEPALHLRVRRDNQSWSRWVKRGLGRSGHKVMLIEFGGFGVGSTFQFEWMTSDDCAIEIAGLDADLTELD